MKEFVTRNVGNNYAQLRNLNCPRTVCAESVRLTEYTQYTGEKDFRLPMVDLYTAKEESFQQITRMLTVLSMPVA